MKQSKKKTGQPKKETSTQEQQQQQQQIEVVNCMNKNKMAKEMEAFKERAKSIENRISSGFELFNADLSSGYQFFVYDFVSLVEKFSQIAINRNLDGKYEHKMNLAL